MPCSLPQRNALGSARVLTCLGNADGGVEDVSIPRPRRRLLWSDILPNVTTRVIVFFPLMIAIDMRRATTDKEEDHG